MHTTYRLRSSAEECPVAVEQAERHEDIERTRIREADADRWIHSSVAGMFASPSVEAAVPPEDLNQYQKAALARAAAKRKRQRPRGAAAASALLKAAGIAGATGKTPRGLEAAAEAERLRLPGAAEWNDEHRRWAPVGRVPRSQKAVARRPLIDSYSCLQCEHLGRDRRVLRGDESNSDAFKRP